MQILNANIAMSSIRHQATPIVFHLTAAALMFGAALAGCAGPAESTEPGQLIATDKSFARRYPTADWIVGTGESTQDARDAENAARARVAEQIESTIESEFRSFAATSTGKADGSANRPAATVDRQNVSSQVKTVAKFAHGELIRVVPESTVCKKGFCTALAVLNRDEAARVLTGEFRMTARDFDTAADRAIAARTVAAFATPYNAARAGFDELTRINARTQAVGRKIAEFDAALPKLDRLEDARASLMAVFQVSVFSGDDNESRDIADRFMKAFDRLGVTVSPVSPCTEGMVLIPSMKLECERVRVGFGHACQALVSAEVRDCAGSLLTTINLTGLDAAGASPRDVDAARQGAISKVTPDALAPELKTHLSNFIPIR